MKMTKKVMTVILACIMLFCVIPINTLAATETQGVWVASKKVSADEETYWVNDGNGGITSEGADAKNYNVKFTPATEETPANLTLDDVSFSKWYVYKFTQKPNAYTEIAGIYTDYEELTITLVGKNTISTDVKIDNYYAKHCNTSKCIYQSNGTLTITGRGSLDLKVTSVTESYSSSTAYGIQANVVNIKGRAKLTIEGGNGIYGDTVNILEKPDININCTTYGTAIGGKNINLSGGDIEASSLNGIFGTEVNLSGYYTEPRIRVSQDKNGDDSERFDGGANQLVSSGYHWVKITERSKIAGFIRNTNADIIEFIGEKVLGPIIAWIISQFI